MMRPQLQSVLCSLAAVLLPVLSCSRDANRASRPDSTAPQVNATADGGATAPFASDGTLNIQASLALQTMIRAVTDSFGTREAIRVVFLPPADSEPVASSQPQHADLIIVSADAASRMFADSMPWLLSFAEMLPDSAASTAASDSNRRPRPSATRNRRRATGRRADSIRADSARREAVRIDSLRADSARADSARQLLLTMPANASNSAVAERYVRYLLTDGRLSLLQSGVRVLPSLVVHGRGAPPGILLIADTIAPPDTAPNRTRP